MCVSAGGREQVANWKDLVRFARTSKRKPRKGGEGGLDDDMLGAAPDGGARRGTPACPAARAWVWGREAAAAVRR